ncbi:MAG: ABC transporter ATP-binding protein [Pseudomonadota bacterium]
MIRRLGDGLVAWLTAWVAPFAPADGPPPGELRAFCRWALSGSEPAIALGIGVTLVAGASELVAAWFTGWAIDTAIAAGPGDFWGSFGPILAAGVAFFLLLRPLIFVADASMTTILLGPHLFPLILSRIHRHTLGHSMRYFENDFAGRISQKELQTARALTDIVVELVDVVFFILAMFLGALVVLGQIDARLLAMILVWFAAYLLLLRAFIPRIQALAAARAGARTAVTGQIVDTLSNISTVKLFARDDFEDRAALDEMDMLRRRSIAFGAVSALFRWLLMTLSGALPLLCITAGVYLWSTGAASAGDIAVAAMVGARISQVTNRVSVALVNVFSNLGEIADGVETLTPRHEITDRPHAAARADHGAVVFENVTFRYGGAVPALTDFSLTIAPGEKVALVGASGAGKSTVTSLLLRLYDVEEGRVTLAGRDIRDLSQAALRQQVSVVRQETAMFNRSALENIRYGRPQATDAQVHEAAERAEAHGFIGDLADHNGRRGYAARLGERGVKLSGGQRQRIALARAILKDAPVLVLDEATSALDSEVEARIQRALAEVMAGKTVLAIAHRLSTIAHMDRIVVMAAGQIVEQGSHAALLARGGAYAGFWARQSGGFLDAAAG